MNTRSDLVPTKLEHITPEWLSAFLGTRTPGVRVEDLEVLDRTQGAATRLRVRVRYASGADSDLPEVLFIKTSLTRQMLVADPHMYLTEVYFYDRIRPEHRLRDPRGLRLRDRRGDEPLRRGHRGHRPAIRPFPGRPQRPHRCRADAPHDHPRRTARGQLGTGRPRVALPLAGIVDAPARPPVVD